MRKNTAKYNLIWGGMVIFILLVACPNSLSAVEKTSQEEKQELSKYLRANWKTPEGYIIEKFSQYDIIFLGEFHRIKHDVELIHNLIPRLYEAGIYNLGIEFGGYEYQDKVDLLVTAQEYDEDMARWLMFKFASYWGMTEYIDIYKKAWELNKSLPKDAPKFRVVNLGYRANWSLLGPNTSVEVRKNVFHKGDPDEFMAKVIFKEFVDKSQTALIYSGSHHAFRNLPNVEARKSFATPEDFVNNVRKDTNMKKRFRDSGVLPANSENK